MIIHVNVKGLGEATMAYFKIQTWHSFGTRVKWGYSEVIKGQRVF